MCFRILPIAREYDRVIPYPGVLLFRLSPESSCILSARLRIIIVFLQDHVSCLINTLLERLFTELFLLSICFVILYSTIHFSIEQFFKLLFA